MKGWLPFTYIGCKKVKGMACYVSYFHAPDEDTDYIIECPWGLN